MVKNVIVSCSNLFIANITVCANQKKIYKNSNSVRSKHQFGANLRFHNYLMVKKL